MNQLLLHAQKAKAPSAFSLRGYVCNYQLAIASFKLELVTQANSKNVGVATVVHDATLVNTCLRVGTLAHSVLGAQHIVAGRVQACHAVTTVTSQQSNRAHWHLHPKFVSLTFIDKPATFWPILLK